MGVKSLWSLLAPVGRPVPLENLEGKALAIDSSIWMYQFQATMRDRDGRALMNAHVLGFLRRICKLLFYGIRPVFVFDGGAPALKRNTIIERKKKKSGAAATHAQVAERLLAAQMRRQALTHASELGSPVSKGGRGSGVLDKNVVYLEDIDSSMPRTPASKKEAKLSTPLSSNSRFYDHDPYRLPHVDVDAHVARVSNAHMPDPRFATEDELRSFIEEMRPEDFDVTSPAFRELPTEIQYEIVGDLRLKSRQTSYKRLKNMLNKAETPLDFSKEQIKNLQQRNTLTQQLLTTTDTIGQAHINIPVRIASERNKEYVLLKNEAAEGGWILGLRNEGTQSRPIEIDQDEKDVISDETEDDMDMEEVSISQPVRSQREVSLDVKSSVTTGAGQLFDPGDEDISDEDPELAMAIQASLDVHAVGPSRPPASIKVLQSPPSQVVSPAVSRSPSPQRAPSATKVAPVDDFEDLYESPSRLETALTIAGAGALQRPSGTISKQSPASVFGTPTLLASLTPAKQLAVPLPSLQGPSVNTEKKIDYTAYETATEELPHTITPVDEPCGPEITADREAVDSDDDMEEVPVGNPPVISANGVTTLSMVAGEEHRQRGNQPSDQSADLLARETECQTVVAEEDQAIEWSRSPSPVDDWQEEADVLPAVRDGVGKEEHWDAVQEMDLHAEEGEFARFISQVKGKDLDAVRKEIDEEIRVLDQQRKAALRDSENITQQMISQIMLMLRLFGIPYITAPMEAEAQCAELARIGLVEGIITDDSDVFLFGGSRVYKNMFNQSKNVECFLLVDLARELGLTRDGLIRLAYLLGSDYVNGLPGIGPVVAMELLKEFPETDGLHRFKDWWIKVQSGRDRRQDSESLFRTRFKKKFKDLYLQQDWPNPLVRDAYYHPAVDSSEEPFKWGIPDLDALRHFLRDELGWEQCKVDELLLPIIQKMNKRTQMASLNRQGDLNEFFNVAGGTGPHAPRKRQAYHSKRLQQVVSEFRKGQAKALGESSDPCNADDGDIDSEEVAAPKKKRPRTRQGKK